jgi:hypothetical protein
MIKAKAIETSIGKIEASMSGEHPDFTTSGDKINAGHLYMTMQGGKAIYEKDGKEIVIEFSSIVPTGATLLQAPNGRHFVLSLSKLINHAIEHGLLDEKLRFEPLDAAKTLDSKRRRKASHENYRD